MDVRLLTDNGIEHHRVDDLQALLKREDGLMWVDIPTCDEEAVTVLSEVFGFHPLAVRDCVERNRVPKVRAYPDHVFVILHAPELGNRATSTMSSWTSSSAALSGNRSRADQPGGQPEVALRETNAVLRRLEAGRLRPSSPYDLSYAIVVAARPLSGVFIETMTKEVWQLEQRVTSGHSATRSSSWRRCSRPATGCSRCGRWRRWAARRTGGWRRSPARFRRTRGRSWPTPSTSSPGSAASPTARRSTCRASSTSTAPGPRPR